MKKKDIFYAACASAIILWSVGYLLVELDAATLSRGQTFAANEQITNTKLHNLVDLGNVSGITDVNVAAANKDGAAATASMRTLGSGALQAAAGNDSRFGAATPASNSVVASSIQTNAIQSFNIAPGQVLGSNIATGGITSTNLQTGSVRTNAWFNWAEVQSTNGSMTFPNGFTMQWGAGTNFASLSGGDNATQVVAFPMVFSSAVYQVVASLRQTNVGTNLSTAMTFDGEFATGNVNTTNFTFLIIDKTGGAGSQGVPTYWAIGK